MPLLPQTSLQDLICLGQNHLHLETVWRCCCQGVYTKGIINVGQLNLSIQLQKTGASSFHIEEDAVIPLIKAGESWLRCIRTGCKSPPTHSPCNTYACQLKSITLPIIVFTATDLGMLPPSPREGWQECSVTGSKADPVLFPSPQNSLSNSREGPKAWTQLPCNSSKHHELLHRSHGAGALISNTHTTD